MLTLIPTLEFPRIYISFLKLWTTIFELPGRRGAFAPTWGENMSPHCRPIGRQRGWMRKSRGVEKLLQKIMEKVKDLETYSWRFELRRHMTLPKKGGYKNQFFDFNKHAGEGKIAICLENWSMRIAAAGVFITTIVRTPNLEFFLSKRAIV